MKKVIISLAVLFSFGTGYYLANNYLFVDNVKTADCPFMIVNLEMHGVHVKLLAKNKISILLIFH